MKNLLEGFKGIIEQAEERISILEDRTMEIVKCEKHKRLRKSEQSLKNLWDALKWTDLHIVRFQKERRESGRIFKEIMPRAERGSSRL